MAVGDSETIRAGLALIVTGPLAVVSVTGNDDPAAAAGEPAAGLAALPALAAVLAGEELAELQPASAAAVAAAIAAASADSGGYR